MKRIVSIFAAITLNLLTMNLFAVSKDAEDHTLVSLWKTYYAAERADKPKDQLAALDAIKAEARKQHLAWDFYDACDKYYSARIRISWKESEAALAQRRSEVTQLGEPVAVVFAGYESDMDKLWEYVCANESKLKASHNPEFYKRDFIRQLVFGEALVPMLGDDYEYAVWCLWARGCKSADVEGMYAGAYPKAAFAEFYSLTRNGAASTKALEEYAHKYDGKAVALFARQQLISNVRSGLDDSKATEAEYLALKADCEKFISDRKAFTGTEKTIADCCRQPDSILARLNDKYVSGNISDGVLNVYFKNLPSTKVQILKDGESVYDTQVSNPARRYCVLDTVKVTLPALDDGSYNLKIGTGKLEMLSYYEKYTLAITTRQESRGIGVSVVDYKTGKPLDKCDLILSENSGKTLCTVRNFVLDGFTLLPDEMADVVSRKQNSRRTLRLQAVAAGGARKSESHWLQNSTYSNSTPDNTFHNCAIIVDRTAFKPGETVNYKAVLYDGFTKHTLCAPGTKVIVAMTDAEGKEIASEHLKTNEFGSVAGSFVLKPCGRGGYYNLSVSSGGQLLDSKNLRVDEFQLPTFDLTWDAPDRFYFPGDKVRFSGIVRSFSGHSLGNAKLTYDLSWIGSPASGELELDADGRFVIESVVPQDNDYGYLKCTVRITDGTGETLEFTDRRWVVSNLNIDVSVLNKDKARFSNDDDNPFQEHFETYSLSEDVAKVRISTNQNLPYPTLDLSWSLEDAAGKTCASGKAAQGEEFAIDLGGFQSGLYMLKVDAKLVTENGKEKSTGKKMRLLKLGMSDDKLPFSAKSFFRELPGDDIALQVGQTEGTAWVFAEVFGEGRVLLDRKLVRIDGALNAPGSLQTISFDRKPGWSDNVELFVMFVKDGQRYSYDRMFMAPVARRILPLAFTRFLDKTLPGRQYTFTITTAPGVECAASIFDASTESICMNVWNAFTPAGTLFQRVYYDCSPGRDGDSFDSLYLLDETMVVGYGAKTKALGRRVMASNAAVDNMSLRDEIAVEEEAIPFQLADGASMPDVRENFASTVAWEPFLRSDADGNLDLKFTNVDKLSTYYVQLFAHDKQCRNNALRQSMIVTIPVKVALVQPQFLYSGDSYRTRVSLANSADADVAGTLSVSYIDGKDRSGKVLGTESGRLTVPAGGTADWQCGIDVPQGIGDLGVLVSFVADDAGSGSDAMFVSVPVLRPVQKLTEAHSAILRAGEDAAALESSLRSMFVNVPGAEAAKREISIRAMLAEALPECVTPKSDDILCQTAALLADLIVSRLGEPGLPSSGREEIVAKIRACHNPDGGFGWFEGMRSSPIVTAVVLERLARISELADLFAADEFASAVKYLDEKQFGDDPQLYWCGAISAEQYMYVRAMYASVPFAAPSGKAFKEFKKTAKEYLTPAKSRGLSGQILAKARRIRTLSMLVASADGESLASAWGVSVGSKLSKSLKADLESLLQYAVDHKCGGCYFPNAVMPWRGLLESEAYAHALLADLLADFGFADKADGVRMWLMLQKETQQWSADPAYVEVLSSVFHATEETLATKVLALSATAELPFEAVKASGNGFTVSVEYELDDKPLKPGDMVHVGDKIIARYNIWNEENRSFVKLTAARPAALRPVQQLSGRYGWSLRPLAVSGFYAITPQGYRSVLADRSEYFFDVYPEENSAITEELFVTQEGAFCAPATTIESLYAPHYRANDFAPARLQVVP